MTTDDATDAALEHFYAELGRLNLEALWRINQVIMPFEPKPRAKPWLWRFEDMARLADQAGKLIPIDRGGDRRVLACLNPGLVDGYGGAVYGATATLWAAVQYLGPHELAPGHRHSPSALRFVVEGSGAWTTVDGDRCDMAAGDLVLTPSYAWHDHHNESDEPMMWFDGLDLPLACYLDAQFFEFYPSGELQPCLDTHGASRAFTAPGLIPVQPPAVAAGAGATPPPEGARPAPRSPLLHYPWEATRTAMEGLRGDRDPCDGVLLRYTNPLTGGPVLPTLEATIQLLAAGVRTAPHRHVHSTVYQVFRGRGETVIDGTRFSWTRGDIMAVPQWAVHDHRAVDGDAILFSITDAPVLEKLGFERVLGVDGVQDVIADFDAS
ncbi:MAG TPA: cupin domain-containing protein [Acidimicrobiia bacterium]